MPRKLASEALAHTVPRFAGDGAGLRFRRECARSSNDCERDVACGGDGRMAMRASGKAKAAGAPGRAARGPRRTKKRHAVVPFAAHHTRIRARLHIASLGLLLEATSGINGTSCAQMGQRLEMRVPAWKSACDRERVDGDGPRHLQHSRALIQRGAGGHDVIHEDE